MSSSSESHGTHDLNAMIKDEVGMGKLVERLRAWLVKRGQPDSGMHYQSNAAHGLSRVELYAADADFVARHFHGSGAVSLADAITALIAERDALAKRLDHYIGMHGVNIRTGRRLVLRERARAEAAEAQLKAARETLEKLACRHVTEQPLWWQLEARSALSTKEG